jgi:hypothetical protein
VFVLQLRIEVYKYQLNLQERKRTWKRIGAQINVTLVYNCKSRFMLSMINVTMRLMWSHFTVPLTTAYWIKTTGFCCYSVYVITLDFDQSDHIKRLLLNHPLRFRKIKSMYHFWDKFEKAKLEIIFDKIFGNMVWSNTKFWILFHRN